jgi:hypothetical protein
VRRLFRRRKPPAEITVDPLWTPAQLDQIRAVARRQATADGVDEGRAGLIAAAVVGALLHPRHR